MIEEKCEGIGREGKVEGRESGGKGKESGGKWRERGNGGKDGGNGRGGESEVQNIPLAVFTLIVFPSPFSPDNFPFNISPHHFAHTVYPLSFPP